MADPTDRLDERLRAQPPGSVDGRIRITEQGEVIDARYDHPVILRRHIAQVVNAVLEASTPAYRSQHSAGPDEAWRAAVQDLSVLAHRAYRELVYETPDFLTYWQQATPIRELGRLHIGSRPAKRTPSEAFEQVRAIPWVFSWTQCRLMLPGWFGLGTALSGYATGGDDRLPTLQAMYRDWPFFQLMIDNAQVSAGRADMAIARRYSALTDDPELGRRIFARIEAEFTLTREQILAVTGQTELLDREPLLQRSIRLRNPYLDALSYLQLDLLERLRGVDGDDAAAGAIREALALTIVGLAAGLESTG